MEECSKPSKGSILSVFAIEAVVVLLAKRLDIVG